MLSRSCSKGTTQLRRAKSAPSVQYHTSASSLIDPVAAKQHAIVAATIAYERSHDRECGVERYIEQPTRRGGNRPRRSEGQGSHFQAGHAPHHQSSKKLSAVTSSTNDNTRSRRATIGSVGTLPTFNTNRHPRSMDIVEFSKTQIRELSKVDNLPFQHVRKSRSTYSTAECAPATPIDAISFPDTPTSKGVYAPLAHCTEGTLTSITEQDITLDFTAPALPPVPLSNNSIYHVDEKVNKARDHHLQQFQMNKLRHRASAMLTPFKKRIGSGSSAETAPLSGISNNGVTYATGCASLEKEHQPARRSVTSDSRHFKTLKDRIKGVFGKSSGFHMGLPVQQVHASRAHFGDLLSASSSRISTLRGKCFSESQQNSNAESLQRFSLPPVHTNSTSFARCGSPTASESTVVTSTSRVTSWADSTIAGTITSRDSHRLTVIHEDQHQAEIASLRSQKRKQSLSFFRRTPKSRAIEVQKPFPEYIVPQIHGDDSTGMQHQPRVQRDRNASPDITTLPSQSKRPTLHILQARANTGTASTVRVVSSSGQTIDVYDSTRKRSNSGSSSILSASKVDSIAKKNQSLEQVDTVSNNRWLSKTERHTLCGDQMGQNPQFIAPSPDQIANRVEKSNQRWKETLEEGRSLFYPRSRQNVSEDLDQTSEYNQESPFSGAVSSEDVFQALREPVLVRPMAVISPSLYSRNTNSVSPKRFYHTEDAVSLRSTSSRETGTAVIITSRPVFKYSVGSAKKSVSHLAKTSRDWRDWISKEVEDLGSPDPEDLALNDDYISKPVDSRHRREHAQIVDGKNLTIGDAIVESIEPLVQLRREPYQSLRKTSPQQVSEYRLPSYTMERGSTEPRSKSPAEIHSESRLQLRKIASRYGPEDRPLSRLHDRSTLRNRSASCMNERFPLIDTSRPPSRQRKPSPPSENENSRNAENIKPKERERWELTPNSVGSIHLQVPVYIAQPTRAAIRRLQSTNSFQRSKSSLAHYTTSRAENSTSILSHTPTHIPKLAAITTPILKTKISLDIRAASRRNHVASVPTANADTDPTLAAISQGPYRDGTASPRPLSTCKSASFYKENSPFQTSSPVRTIREGETSSFPATPTSGGQRLAEQFLSARRLRSDISESSSVGSPTFL
jgi:hypothetical protein